MRSDASEVRKEIMKNVEGKGFSPHLVEALKETLVVQSGILGVDKVYGRRYNLQTKRGGKGGHVPPQTGS